MGGLCSKRHVTEHPPTSFEPQPEAAAAFQYAQLCGRCFSELAYCDCDADLVVDHSENTIRYRHQYTDYRAHHYFDIGDPI